MKVFATYCSKNKVRTKEWLPLLALYRSTRIYRIYEESRLAKTPFFILSGRYGLIDSTAGLPWYDHLLRIEEVDAHSQKVAKQIQDNKISEVVFYSRTIEQDSNIEVYLKCIKKACQMASANFELIEI